MPVNITASNGQQFHLWQLPDLSAPEPEDGHRLTTLKNELSEGYRSSKILGLHSGVRSWNLNLPTLAGASVIPAAVTDPYGATVSREQYVRNLYKYNRTTGVPFAYPDPNNNGQYYLVDFVDSEPLSMSRAKGVSIFATAIQIRQRRIKGVSVFDPTKITNYASLHWYNETSHGSGVWNDKQASGPINLTATGDVVFNANPQNSKNTVRLGGSSNGGLSASTTTDIADAIIVFKLRSAPSGTTASIIHPYVTADTTTALLRTFTSSTTLTSVLDLTLTGNTSVNNQFAVVLANGRNATFNSTVGVPLAWAVGYSFDGSRYAKADIAEVWLFSTPLSRRDAYEAADHLRLKWGIA